MLVATLVLFLFPGLLIGPTGSTDFNPARRWFLPLFLFFFLSQHELRDGVKHFFHVNVLLRARLEELDAHLIRESLSVVSNDHPTIGIVALVAD